MAISGTVQVTGPIAPSLVTDDYPTHDSDYGLGGYREVADVPARDAIPIERQKVGMLVWVADRGDTQPETYVLTAVGTPGTYAVAFPGVTGVWNDGGTYLYPSGGASKIIVVGSITAPTDPSVIMEVTNGNFQVGSTWNGPHMIMGTYHFWVDSSNRLRMKNGAPASDTDGIIVGMQS